MLETWLHTFALIALGFVAATLARRIIMLERQVTKLERRVPTYDPQLQPNRMIHEDEWVPPIMKHKEIKS